MNDLKQVRYVIVPRWYFNMGEKSRSCSLIGFCDAFRRAYAAVVYLRVETDSGCCVRFVAAKAAELKVNLQMKDLVESDSEVD